MLGYGTGDLIGQRGDIVVVAVVALGPDVLVGVGADELESHVDLADRAGDRAFQDAVDVEVAGYFRQRRCASLICLAEVAGNDAEGGILGEHGRQFVGHAVGEVLMALVAGEVIERDDGEGRHGGPCIPVKHMRCQRMRAEGEYRNGSEQGDT